MNIDKKQNHRLLTQKGNQIFRVDLSIMEHHKFLRIFCVINN